MYTIVCKWFFRIISEIQHNVTRRRAPLKQEQIQRLSLTKSRVVHVGDNWFIHWLFNSIFLGAYGIDKLHYSVHLCKFSISDIFSSFIMSNSIIDSFRQNVASISMDSRQEHYTYILSAQYFIRISQHKINYMYQIC